MEFWQQRVVEEKKELDERHTKLDKFIKDPNPGSAFNGLPASEQDRLKRQWKLMNEYSGVLAERIDAWDDPLPTNTLPKEGELYT